MALTAERVEDVVRDCLFREGESTDDAVKVEGIVRSYGFHPGRLDAHRMEIGELLRDLPGPFMQSEGGGWSFLNACNDRRGVQWTGLHQTMEGLFVLGIATGQAEYLLPREMWDVLPGGMPYIVVHDRDGGE